MGHRAVEFPSEGATLRGRLYTPAAGAGPHPLVVMAHGFTATVTMTIDRYAEVFQAHGLAVLLYDHRNIRLSGGEPRREVNSWVQARGYRDAVRFARASLPGIDPERVALWGDSNSAAQVLVLAAALDGIAAVAAMTPSCGAEPPPADPDGQLFAALRETLESGDVAATPETTAGPLPVVSWDLARHPAHLEPLSAFRWFMEHGGRHGSGWANDATRANPPTPAPFNPGIAAPHARVPVQVVYASDDEMPRANPAVTRAVCESLPEPKEIVALEEGCGHFGHLWHPSAWFDRVSTLQAAFLVKHLAARRVGPLRA